MGEGVNLNRVRKERARAETKAASAALSALGVTGRALVVIDPTDTAANKSFRNLSDVHVISPGELNTYDVLVSDYVVFSEQTLPAADKSAAEVAS